MSELDIIPLAYAYKSLGPTLSALSLVVLLLFCVVGVGLLFFLAVLPGRLARERRHPQADAVRVCGWLGLLTGIGWIVAMVWAFVRSETQAKADSESLDALESAVGELESAAGGASK